MPPPPTEDSETKPQSKLPDKIPANTEQSKPGPLKETNAMKFKAIVKYSYEAKHKDELTQTKGDTTNSLDKDLEESGCWKGELNGQICVFPDNYVEIIKEEPNPKMPPPPTKASETKPQSELPDKILTDTEQSKTSPVKETKAMKFKAIVKYSYEAKHKDELTQTKGDTTNSLDKDLEGSGCWKGELNGQICVFPDNYVEIIKEEPNPKMPPPPTRASETKPQSKLPDKIPTDTEQSKTGPVKETKAMKFKAIVKYSYEAKHKDELTQTKGDTTNSLDKDLEESGCWKGELNGQICVFPDNYVEIIKEEPNPKMPPPPTRASETKPQSKLPDKIPTDTEQSKTGPVKETTAMKFKAIVKFSYEAKHKDELTQTKGDTTNSLDKDLEESGCWKGELNGQICVFPDNYVEIIKEEPNPKMPPPHKQASETKPLSKLPDKIPTDTEQSKPGPVKETTAMKFKAIVKFSYEAKHKDELTQTKGDTTNSLDKDLEESGCWKGELNGQICVFPDNYVEIIKEEPNPKMPPPHKQASETKPLSKLPDKIPTDTEQSKPGPVKETKAMKFKAIVKYSYEAKHEDELTQTKGDTTNSLDKDLEESGCWKGELNGQICVFPDNYVEIIKEEPNPKMPSPPTKASETKPRSKLPDKIPADTEQSKTGPVKELPTNWKESLVWRHGLMIVWILFAFGVQYLLFGNFGKTDIQPDGIRNMEGRLADFDMALSTLKKQQINDKGIFHDMVEKFKNEMTKKDETKLKELTKKVNSAASDVSSAKEILNVLEEARDTLEDRYKEIEETIMNLESTLNNKISAILKFNDEFGQTFSKYEQTFSNYEQTLSNYETSLQTFEIKTERKMHEMTKTFEDKSSRIKEQVKDFSKDFDQKLEEFKQAKSDLDEILSAVKKDVDTIKPNTFNKESLTMAFIIVVLFEFILALWIYLVQCGRSTYSDSSDGSKDMTARDVLERIPRRVALSDFVCIVSFDEARQTEHDTLVKSALGTIQDIQMKYFVVRRHEHLQKLPKCKFYIMCTEFSERHVIIEEPGLGLGDLKRCTYEVIKRYRADMVILYTRDPGSRSLGDELYNPNIYCVDKQPELMGLRDKRRFISTYDKLTEVQKRVLHDDIAKCMK